LFSTGRFTVGLGSVPSTVGQDALGICLIVGNGGRTNGSRGVEMDILEGLFLVQIFLGEIFLGKNLRLVEHDVKARGTYTPDLASTLSVS